MSRHKWDKTYWDKEGHATCIKCGCVKEKHFPVTFYFVEGEKMTVGVYAPECINKKSND